ncbi:unnamed protein product [Thlaspi arvense]|uniref:Uncharacterized protein n=1 Tax=Thlaspi arvense TaxID=13288 RepID=A0AAU9RQW1_THLAR|nr:unnamed protein product [Thlaspi arvense]
MPMGPPPPEKQKLRVSDLLLHDKSGWDTLLIRENIPAHESEILKLQPSTLGAHDCYIWLPTEKGMYNVLKFHSSLGYTGLSGAPETKEFSTTGSSLQKRRYQKR